MLFKLQLLLVSLVLALFLGVPAALAQSTVVKREPVEFPKAAQKAGFDTGKVRAKVTIDAAGNVVDVQILDATPPRVFDSAVRNSLKLWKYNTGDNNRTAEVVIDFKLGD
jgi:TonB family protein